MEIVRLNPAAVKSLIALNGLSQRQLAKTTGLSESYLSELVHGHKSGSAPTWKKLADNLGVEIIDIITEDVA